MKALFIGAGSIGRRHIKDFYRECNKHNITPTIHVLRRQIGDLGNINPFVSKQITSIDDEDYDVVFITNPTNLHFDALQKCKGKAKWYFIEKPIFEKSDYDLTALGINDQNAYVAAPMRHTLIYKKAKEIVQNNKVFSSRIICSSYLPNWRPNIDYRNNYSAIKEMGGGVNLDLIHEIDYAYDLFGPPVEVFSVSGKYSDLEITSNDLSTYIFKYESMLCEIHLDYFGKKNLRTCELFVHDGTYTIDFFKETITTPDNEIIDCHVIESEEFINEMAYFYDFITTDLPSINPPSLATKTLEIVLKGECQ